MGRHSKGVANMFAVFRAIEERRREFDAWATDLPDDEKRPLFRQWWASAAKAQAEGKWVRACPSSLRGLTCGANKRDGQTCRSTTLCANGRCKFHGGRSTGPRTPEGRAKALENLKLGRLIRGDS